MSYFARKSGFGSLPKALSNLMATFCCPKLDKTHDKMGGKRLYIPEEVAAFGIDRNSPPYDASKAVVWSLGVVLFAMIFHSFPYNSPSQNDPKYVRLTSGRWVEDVIIRRDRQQFLTKSCLDLVTQIFRDRIGIRDVKGHDFSQPLP